MYGWRPKHEPLSEQDMGVHNTVKSWSSQNCEKRLSFGASQTVSSSMAVELRLNLPCTMLRKMTSIASIQRSFRLDLFLLLFLLSIPRSISELNPMQGFCAIATDSDCSSSFTKILIKGGTVVNAHHKEVADVYIEDGIIVSVRPNIKVGDDVKILDATGKYVMPGGIDPHTHLEMEFMGTVMIDDFFTGQAGALAGGTTMHIDFVIPVNGSLSAGFDSYMNKAKTAVMDYGFHMAVNKWDDEVAKDMELMVKENGINSFKFFMAYKGALMVNDELLIQGLEKCKSLGALAMVHAENGDAVAEGQKRMIDLGITGPEGHALSRPPVVILKTCLLYCTMLIVALHFTFKLLVSFRLFFNLTIPFLYIVFVFPLY
ncbi:dihydropyrimidinase-like [Phoenix dactylifera]|uniref:dihydropyrimidinase n=1 Tax=Phoenix dactylifera TaxID=42345 RepID=A0A8B9APA5_PHODC|nr:dihydropyrimidinase-like [Phoenix dactylifera]